MPSWECPVPTPAYLVLDKETVQYEMTLAGQTLAADLLAPLLRLAFISPLLSTLTGNPSKFLYCLYSSIQVQPTWLGLSRWSSSCITGLVHADVCVMKFGHVLYVTQDQMVSHLHTFQCRQGQTLFVYCHRWHTPFVLSVWCHCDQYEIQCGGNTWGGGCG